MRTRVLAVAVACFVGVLGSVTPVAAAQDDFFQGLSARRWAARLRDPDPHVVRETIRVLIAGGADAVPMLLVPSGKRGGIPGALRRRILIEIGAPAVAPLVARLESRTARPDEPATALLLLAALGPRAEGAIPAVLRWLTEPQAYLSLAGIGPASVPALREVLRGADARRRERALTVLGMLGPDAAPALPEILAALKDPDGRFRALAAETLGKLGPAADVTVPDLIAALEDGRFLGRIAAVSALAIRGKDRVEVVPALLAALRAKRGDAERGPFDGGWRACRRAAVSALGSLGPLAEDALPALRDLHDDEDAFLRIGAAAAMARIEGDTARSVGLLLKELEAECDVGGAEWGEGSCDAAAKVLGGFGEDAAPAVPLLVRGLSRSDATEKGPHSVVCADALGEIGPKAAPALPGLYEMLGSKWVQVRFVAARAIWRIERKPDAVREVFSAVALDDVDRECRRSALDCLGEMGAGARPAIPALLELLARDGDTALVPPFAEEFRRDMSGRCHRILRGLGPDADAAVPALVWQLGSPFAEDRTAAVATLVTIGRGPIPALREAVQGENAVARESARKALAALE